MEKEMTELNEVLQETLQEALARRNIRLVLASASPRRRELFHQAELFPEIIPSHKEERSAAKTPAALVKALSRTKAEDIAERFAGSDHGGQEILVAGADTIVVLDGKVLGKPKDPEDAVRMLESLSGRAHHVYTGVTLILLGGRDAGAEAGESRRISFFEKTAVEVYPLTGAEIRAYVESGDPLDKAGAYGIQGKGSLLCEKISGDYFNIVGLPIARVARELKAILNQ